MGMNKYLMAIGLILIVLTLLNCPPEGGGLPSTPPGSTGTPPPGNPTLPAGTTATPTSTPLITLPPGTTATPVPSPIIIDNFEAYASGATLEPGNGWTYDCNTNYPNSDNTGVIVKFSPDGQGLNLMLDIFGETDSFGKNYTGYAYVMKSFHAPAAGTISFSYYQKGFNGVGNTPSFSLDFWLQAPADIANDNNPVWTNSIEATSVPFAVHTENIPGAGDYDFTWRVKKNIAAIFEDEIYIDNIIFTYQ